MIEFGVQTRDDPIAMRGTSSTMRLSSVHSARPVLRIGRHRIPLGRYVVVIENIEDTNFVFAMDRLYSDSSPS